MDWTENICNFFYEFCDFSYKFKDMQTWGVAKSKYITGFNVLLQ